MEDVRRMMYDVAPRLGFVCTAKEVGQDDCFCSRNNTLHKGKYCARWITFRVIFFAIYITVDSRIPPKFGQYIIHLFSVYSLAVL